MKQNREETGFEVKTYDVIKSAVLDFNKALNYMANRVTETTNDDDLSSFVDRWWSDLRQVYRGLRLSLEAEGGLEVSLFYLQTRVLDAIWNACWFSRRDGPSPWKDMKIDVMKYGINGKGDCIVKWNDILPDLQEDPAKAERILVSPRGFIEYSIKVAHREVSAGNEGAVNGVSGSASSPTCMAGPARQKRKHAHAGQQGKAMKTRRKHRVSPDFVHRNADAEDDSSDFDVKSEEDQAGKAVGSQSTAMRIDKTTKLSQSTSGSDSKPTAGASEVNASMHLSKVQSGSGSGPKKALKGTGKSTKRSKLASNTHSQGRGDFFSSFMKNGSRQSDTDSQGTPDHSSSLLSTQASKSRPGSGTGSSEAPGVVEKKREPGSLLQERQGDHFSRHCYGRGPELRPAQTAAAGPVRWLPRAGPPPSSLRSINAAVLQAVPVYERHAEKQGFQRQKFRSPADVGKEGEMRLIQGGMILRPARRRHTRSDGRDGERAARWDEIVGDEFPF